jgi:hypothetical protein
MQDRSEVVFIGGRSGVGKSSAAYALHSMLSELDVKHCVIEGDTLDLARHLDRSRLAALRLERDAPPEVHRIDTDGLGIDEVAAAILTITGWADAGDRPAPRQDT